jgi:DNA-binding MarR family transcriptional regulator
MPGARRTQADAADALLAVAPLVSRWIERLLAGHDPPLTLAQYLALRAIERDGVGGAELARRAGVSGPAVSQLVSALTEGGMLERHEHAEDRRRQALALSSAGRRAFRSAEALVTQRLGSLLAELPEPEADALARALPHVEAAISGQPPPRRPRPPRPAPPPRGRRERDRRP